MKKFTIETNEWVNQKVCNYMENFIRNHDDVVEDNDTFEIFETLLRNDAESFIRRNYKEAEVKRMEKQRSVSMRLDFDDCPKEIIRCVWNNPDARKKLRSALSMELKSALSNSKKAQDEILPIRIKELQDTLSLSDLETEIFTIQFLIRQGMLCSNDPHSGRSGLDDRITFTAKCLDCDVNEIRKYLGPNGKLRKYQCLDEDLDYNRNLHDFLHGLSKEPLTHNYFRKADGELLPWSFFGKLTEQHGEMLKSMLRNCSPDRGLNILLYGAPGTGKTSFAHALAHEVDRTCYDLAQDINSDGPSRSTPEFRFGALQLCDTRVDQQKSIIIIDEADDMLSGGNGGGIFEFFGGAQTTRGDKGMLNTVLDKVRTSTIWITNTPAEALDESSRRRFDYSICFAPLDCNQRRMIWMNNIQSMNMTSQITEQQTSDFAEKYEVSAGIITTVLKNLRDLKPEQEKVPDTVRKLMTQHCELLQIPLTRAQNLPATDYSLDGLNIRGDINLDRIVQAVRRFQAETWQKSPDVPRMNLLLSGPPGTGKTEFVKYLGSVLNTKITVQMGSDLLSMYVGGTEQNIKQAFARAEAEKTILFLDEIDGLVQNRSRSQRSWEVTQVNELLYQMENFNGVMIGATNFMENLDPAILRRFTFKLGFDYLTNDGKKLFFERMFQTTLTNAELIRLNEIPNLAPGDFRTVRQSLYYLGNESDNASRLSGLERESQAKNLNRPAEKKKMGFDRN